MILIINIILRSLIWKNLVFNDFANFSILNKKEMKDTEGKFIQIIVPLAFGWGLTTANAPTVGNNCGSCHSNKVC